MWIPNIPKSKMIVQLFSLKPQNCGYVYKVNDIDIYGIWENNKHLLQPEELLRGEDMQTDDGQVLCCLGQSVLRGDGHKDNHDLKVSVVKAIVLLPP